MIGAFLLGIYFVGVVWMMHNIPSRIILLCQIDNEKVSQEVSSGIVSDIIAGIFWPIIFVGALLYAVFGARRD